MSNRLSQEKSPYLQQPVTDYREPALYDTFVSAANSLDTNHYTAEKI